MATRVRFVDDADAQRYLGADQPLPDPQTLLRPVAAGELVPAAALGDPRSDRLLSVPVSVPRSLGAARRGSGVGGRRVGDGGDGVAASAGRDRVLSDVVVLAAPPATDGFGGHRRPPAGAGR